MSAVRDPATDQPLPAVNDQPFVQDLVLADIEERKQHGIRKYGTALQVGNGRSMLQDAYEEVLDLAVYLRGLLEEERIGVRVTDSAAASNRPRLSPEEIGVLLDHSQVSPEQLGETVRQHAEDARSPEALP